MIPPTSPQRLAGATPSRGGDVALRRHLPRPSRRYAIFALVSAAFGLALFQRAGLAAIAGPLLTQFQLNAGQLGTLASSYFYIYAVMQFPIGIIIDRWGARQLMTVLLAIATLGSFIFALAPSFAWLIVGRTLVGMGVSVCFIALLKLLAAWFPVKDLALWNGLALALADIGVLAAGRPLVEVAGRIGWSGAFLIAASLMGIVTLLVWIVVRDEPARAWETGWTRRASEPAASRADLLQVLRSPIVWVMGVGVFFISGTQASFQGTWAGPYLTDVYGLAPAVMGNLLMLIPLGRMLGNLTHGWIADRIIGSRAATTALGLGIFAASWIPLALWPAGLSLTGLAALYGGSFGFAWVTLLLLFPILRAKFAGRVAGTASGIVNLLSILGIAATQQLFGALINRYPPAGGHYPPAAYQLMFIVGLGMSVVGWLITMLATRLPGGHKEN